MICVNGGRRKQVEGTWSASARVARRSACAAFPTVAVRRGSLSHQVVGEVRLVPRGCSRSDRRSRVAAHAAARVLDGRSCLVRRRRATRPLSAFSALHPGFPSGSHSTGSVGSGFACCTVASTAPCPVFPACLRTARAPGSSARSRSAPTANTRSFPAPSTRSRYVLPGEHRCPCRGPGSGCSCAQQKLRGSQLTAVVRNGTAPTSRRFAKGHFRAGRAAATKDGTSSTSDRSRP